MGVYTFKWPDAANEVYVTGTFDNWTRSVKLDKTDDGFQKEVELPNSGKNILYKFVVDGVWKADQAAPQEADGDNNINNVLLPEHIKHGHSTNQISSTNTTGGGIGIMSGVTPEATTTGLAGEVPKESTKAAASQNRPTYAAVSSAAPGSTTAQLAKDVPLVKKQDAPGTFPETPVKEPEQFSVNPIPASDGAGNPVILKPGEKVPHSSNVTNNTIGSTATTDKAGYEKDASAPGMAALAGNPGKEYIQSAAPQSTTAGMAGAVPIQSTKRTDSQVAAEDVPEVVRESISRSNTEPEAAAVEEAVEEKKEVESELLRDVKPVESTGEPAPTVAAGASSTAPGPTESTQKTKHIRELSPKSKDPTAAPAESTPEGPTATTGPETSTVPQTSAAEPSTAKQQQPSPGAERQAVAPAPEDTGKDTRKKSRLSGFFAKLKEKMK